MRDSDQAYYQRRAADERAAAAAAADVEAATIHLLLAERYTALAGDPAVGAVVSVNLAHSA